MSIPTLRPYQAELVRDVYGAINSGKDKIAIIAGTGAGKTIIGGKICYDANVQGARVMFLVHLDVLVGQTYEKMQAFGLRCGFIKNGWPEDRSAPIQISSIQTMAQRKWWKRWPADIVFFDEAHQTLFSKVGQEILHKTHRQSIVLAMTATPERLGKAQLGDYLDTFVAAPPPAELQRMGFLSQMQYYALPPADVSRIKTGKDGDFITGSLRTACDRPEMIQKIVNEWYRLTPGKRTIGFCVDVDHAEHTAEAFRQAGVPAASVDGSTPIERRNELYAALRQEDILLLTSCNVISIGFDEPSVEVGLLLRPTQSSALHFQQVGRVMRISPETGKLHGIILDQAGNLERLGYPEDINITELPSLRNGAGRAPSNKMCPECQQQHPNFVVRCGCGFFWEQRKKVDDRDLVRLYSRSQASAIKDPRILREIFSQFRQRAFVAGYDLAIAEEQFYAHTGRWPKPEWYTGALFKGKTTPEAIQSLTIHLQRTAALKGFEEDWIQQELAKEFERKLEPIVQS